MLEYKGYRGTYEPDQGLLFGRVVGIRGHITFVGQTPEDAQKAFRQSVIDYVDFYRERSELSAAPSSGDREQGCERESARTICHACGAPCLAQP